MTSTLFDTNILIDLFGDDRFATASRRAATEALGVGPVVISAIVWAELAVKAEDEEDLLARIAWMRAQREPLPFAAAFPAGQAQRLYRERGGRRDRTLPDFLIGAHALVGRHRLLTRDPARYVAYFPDIEIICPEAHP